MSDPLPGYEKCAIALLVILGVLLTILMAFEGFVVYVLITDP